MRVAASILSLAIFPWYELYLFAEAQSKAMPNCDKDYVHRNDKRIQNIIVSQEHADMRRFENM